MLWYLDKTNVILRVHSSVLQKLQDYETAHYLRFCRVILFTIFHVVCILYTWLTLPTVFASIIVWVATTRLLAYDYFIHNEYNNYYLKIRAVAGQHSSPDLCFATKLIKIYDP